jgi:hypothetical protein
MNQLSHIVPDPDSPPTLVTGELGSANAELNMLLLRCSELSKDLARMHSLLKRLAHNTDLRQLHGNSGAASRFKEPSRSPNSRRHATAGRTRQPYTDARSLGPVHSELARACRIALIETNEPASVETIYDRIQRRGSFSFAGYKHPFRAIVLAMSAMVKQGDASLVNEGGRRRWCWATDQTPFEQRVSFASA